MPALHMRVAALLGTMALAAVPAAFAQSGGAVTCYRVKDPVPHRAFTMSVTNAGVTQSCRVKVPARLGCLGTQDLRRSARAARRAVARGARRPSLLSHPLSAAVPASRDEGRRARRPAHRQVQARTAPVYADDGRFVRHQHDRPGREPAVYDHDDRCTGAVRVPRRALPGHVRKRRPLLRGRIGRRLPVPADGVRRCRRARVRRLLRR